VDEIRPAETVRICVLGALQIQDADGRAVRVGGHRLRALLIMLALDAGRVVPAHSLIDRLWPGGQPADAVNALQSLVSRLRATLRDAGVGDGLIESSPAGYRLAVPPEAVDAVAFEARARRGGRALAAGDAATAARVLREALSAWRGPALADVADEEFAAAPAARLEELRLTADLDRIEADLALGEAGGGLTGELRAMTAADPLAERPRALLMRALAATGRQADALAVYQQGRDLLADRLGVDPSPPLEQVYLAVLRGEIPQARPAVPPPPAGSGTASPNQEVPLAQAAVAVPPAGTGAPSPYPERSLPTPPAPARPAGGQRPPTSFIGRDDDVSGVLKKLAEERLVTLTGPGGVGKTRLAAEAAGRLGTTAWFAALAPVTEPSQVPSAVLDALGLGERVIGRHGADGAGDPVAKLSGALAGRDAVLVLDNCEHVIEAAAQLAERLLADCARVRILATSREPLRIGGEVLWVVPPLAVPPAPPVPPAPTAAGPVTTPPAAAVPDVADIYPYPAVQLFADRAAAVQPSFVVDESNAAAVARICRALDGLPLAIELAVVWLRTLTPAQLAERLDRRFALLTSGSRTALPRHQTLRAVVDWSWNLLSGAERVLARRLALFPGGATLTAAEQVCADPAPGDAGAGLARADVLPALSGLVGKSILAVADDPGESGPRYRMLETVRAYALERLAEAGEDTRVRDAYTGYYLAFAETADPALRSTDQVRWFRELMAEQDNLHAALRWAIATRDAGVALRFVRALSYFWVQRGHGEGDSLARETLALEPPPLTTLQVVEARVICALLAAGWSWDIETIREQLTSSIALLDQWSAEYESYHPIAAMAEPLLAQYDGDQEKSLAMFERYAAARDPWLQAMGRLYRAMYASALGRLDRAEDDCRAALALFRELGETWGTAITLTQVAEFVELRADHAAAIAALEEAVTIGRRFGSWGDMSYVEGKLAVIRARTGEVARAQADLDRVERETAERGANSDTDRWTAFMRAELAWHAGDMAGVIAACQVVLAGIEGLRAGWWASMRAHLMTRLAMVARAQDDLERCRELLGEAHQAVLTWVEHPTTALVLDAIAAYVLRRGRDADAELAATLLGAAHAVRGAFDESSLDAPAARAAARAALGDPAFETAYATGRALTYADALTRACGALLGG
jgi:predicted ATPase/DNA-binding SARP family transcriptional activator